MSTQRSQFVCILEPVRAGTPESPTPEEAELIARHFDYDCRKRDEGLLILAGRSLKAPWIGIFIFEADSPDHARHIVADDPAVLAGIFTARVQPFRVALTRT
ncbi:MAG: hypothetical protein D6695_06160 [Planctomycetota bacterium]|nr:MAG: hypothetical protein D6695_06160 [Planctomycetota bacterium]